MSDPLIDVRREGAACQGMRGARARSSAVARRLPRLAACRRRCSARTGRSDRARLDEAAGTRRYAAEIDAVARTLKRLGHLAAARRLCFRLHGAAPTRTAQGPRPAPHARLAVPRPRGASSRCAAQGGPAGEFLNVTWPGFVGVLTARGAGALRRLDQPGADAPPLADSDAAVARLCAERPRRLAQHAGACRPSICCATSSRPARVSTRRAICWKPRRLRGPSLHAGRHAAGRAHRDRTRGDARADLSRRHGLRQRLARAQQPLAALRLRRGRAGREQHPPPHCARRLVGARR